MIQLPGKTCQEYVGVRVCSLRGNAILGWHILYLYAASGTPVQKFILIVYMHNMSFLKNLQEGGARLFDSYKLMSVW